MELNKKTLITMALTLGVGIAIGALFLGGGSTDNAATGHEGHAHEQSDDGTWTCSMHPQVRQSEPGACPFCGMDLIPVAAEGDDDPAVLKMSNDAVQLANIQTSTVSLAGSESSILLNGKVTVDERKVNTQATHFGGRIEKLYKNYEGQVVRKGEVVAAIHSPELISAQEELIEARKLAESNPVLLEAARNKLRYWKLTPEQIKTIEMADMPIHEFELLADYDGVITHKMVNTGDHLHEGGALMQITDLSRVWVVFEVYEKDLTQVKLNDIIRFSSPGLREEMEAKISFISPEVDPATRIVKVRVEVDNRNGALKPDMFVRAQLKGKQGETLKVPKSAVLWTGKRSIVYVQKGSRPEFELREIVLGKVVGDFYEVMEGLEAGEKVVTNGAFTIDAEAQLRGKTSMMNPSILVDNPEDAVFEEVQLPAASDMQGMVEVGFQNQLMDLSLEYLVLKDLMVEGNGTDIRKAGVQVREKLQTMDKDLTSGDAAVHWASLMNPMTESLELITTTGDRDVQRLQFINLSKALINAVQSFGTSFESPLYVQFCPMANNDKGATWISREEEIINPYFGDVMLNCGNVEEVIEND